MSGSIGLHQADSSTRSVQERLDSWKEIAVYLHRSERSVRRWEKEERLPVHRHMHSKSGSVYAYREELDRWWISHDRSAPAPNIRLDSWKGAPAHLPCSECIVMRSKKEGVEEIARASIRTRAGALRAVFE